MLVLILLMAVAACSSDGSDGDSAGDPAVDASSDSVVATASAARGEFKPVIELAVTDWTAARLNVAIAEQLIERRLGYPVEGVEAIDTRRMLSDLAAGDLHAVLEVWPGSLEERDREVLASGRVERLGPLGVVGKVGWFTPRSVVAADPTLADWEGLADAGVAGRFATAETAPDGRFLGTDPAYVQSDEELIEALGLPFQVVYSGSDAATAAEVERAVNADEPVLLYWWTPTAAIVRFDLVEVALPERTARCEADIAAGRPQACDYPEEPLMKLAWPGLAALAPDLHRFLGNFELTTTDQLLLIDQVENQGISVESAAGEWIDNNSDRWEKWLP